MILMSSEEPKIVLSMESLETAKSSVHSTGKKLSPDIRHQWIHPLGASPEAGWRGGRDLGFQGYPRIQRGSTIFSAFRNGTRSVHSVASTLVDPLDWRVGWTRSNFHHAVWGNVCLAIRVYVLFPLIAYADSTPKDGPNLSLPERLRVWTGHETSA